MAEALLAAVRHSGAEEPVRSLLAAPHVAAEVNKLGPSGVNALGLAVWRNHAGLVEVLLEAGADPDVPDSESGWTALHRALHWGQLRTAAALLRANASLAVPDWRGRSPLDLLSAELREFLEAGDGDVFSWGNGNNYTLGTASTDVLVHPTRVESLHDQQVVAVSAAKFHSVAVTVDGRLLTWGWGRGGRLGHPEAHVHSGEGAVIAPLVVSSLGRRQVAAVAAAKHHTILCTTAGEVYTCGSNRHGQLGYAVDSQPTPRRVSALRHRVVAVAAANKHSVAVTAAGDVYTWGANVLGQLGYGTSDSACNATPRLVEAMRGKPVAAAAAAKRHTLVLTENGEVYTWGHRGVSPRRVQLAGARDAASLAGAPISFHRGHADVARPMATAICAGAAHSSALTDTGVVLTWRSADPALQVQEVGGVLAGKRVVSVAAGKYRTAACSDEGDIYMWEGRSDYFPAEGRQPGSGSKKPGSASASRARPIPGRPTRLSSAGDAPLGGSYGSADVGPGFDSYGSASHSRRAGSWMERFGRERESGGTPGSYGAAGSPGWSGSKPSRASDTFERIRPERVEGLKRAAAVAVGEKHSLAVQRWTAAQLQGLAPVPWLLAPEDEAAPGTAASSPALAEEESWYDQAGDDSEAGSLLASPREEWQGGSGAAAAGLASPGRPSPVRPGPQRERLGGAAVGVPSLQRVCEEVVARRLVDPRTCLQVLEYADVAGADTLRSYCLAVAVCNLDAVLLEAGGAFEELSPHLLAELERLFKLRVGGATTAASGAPVGSSSAYVAPGMAAAPARLGAEGREGEEKAAAVAPARAGSRLQPGRRPTCAAPWLGDEGLELGEGLAPGIELPPSLAAGGSSFRDRSQADAEAAALRLLRTLQRKLQQTEHLAAKAAAGAPLDAQQRFKLDQQPVFLSALAALEGGMAVDDVQSILLAASAGRELDPELVAAGASCDVGGSQGGAAASASKQAKAKGKRAGQKPVEGEPEDVAVAAAAAELGGDSSLLGSSPPAGSLVPAFGLAGSAAGAAADLGELSGAGVQGSPPGARIRSLVGFDSSSASDGLGAPVGGQQASAVGRGGLSGVRPKSASKRKGGLSMFLRGELEATAAAAAPAGADGPADSPAAAGPAWGAKSATPAGGASLRQILDQEAAGSASKAPGSAQRATPNSGIKSRPALESPSASAGTNAGAVRLSLASFMQSSPMAMQRAGRGAAASVAAPPPPPPAWGGATGASPPSGKGQRSFRDIQEEQEALQPPPPPPKVYGTSPPTVQRLTTGLPPWRPPAPAAVGASLLGTSPSGSGSLLGTSPLGRSTPFVPAPVPQQSKWYIPDDSRADTRKSLVSIQTEEEAITELAKSGFDSARVLPKAERRSPGLPRPGRQAHVGGPSGGAADGEEAAQERLQAERTQAEAAPQHGEEGGGGAVKARQHKPRRGAAGDSGGSQQQQQQQGGEGSGAAGAGDAAPGKHRGGRPGSGRPGSGKPRRRESRDGEPAGAEGPESAGKPRRRDSAGGNADKVANTAGGSSGKPKPRQRRATDAAAPAAEQGGAGTPKPRQHRGKGGGGGRPSASPLPEQGGGAAAPRPQQEGTPQRHQNSVSGTPKPVAQQGEGSGLANRQPGSGRRPARPPRQPSTPSRGGEPSATHPTNVPGVAGPSQQYQQTEQQ